MNPIWKRAGTQRQYFDDPPFLGKCGISLGRSRARKVARNPKISQNSQTAQPLSSQHWATPHPMGRPMLLGVHDPGHVLCADLATLPRRKPKIYQRCGEIPQYAVGPQLRNVGEMHLRITTGKIILQSKKSGFAEWRQRYNC